MSWPWRAGATCSSNLIGEQAEEVDDRELLAVPIEGVDVYVTSKDVDGKTAGGASESSPASRGIFLRKIVACVIAKLRSPILPNTQIQPWRQRQHFGWSRTSDVGATTKMLGRPDRATDVADVAFIGARHCDWRPGRRLRLQDRKRAAHPVHLRRRADLRPVLRVAAIRAPDLRPHPVAHRAVAMNPVGLNVFIAIVGISSDRICRRTTKSSASACSSGVSW